MHALNAIPESYRAVVVAVAVSAALHGAALVGWLPLHDDEVSLEAPAYTARLEADATVDTRPAQEVSTSPPPRPRARSRSRPKKVLLPEEAVALLPDAFDSPTDLAADEAGLPDLAAAPDTAPPEIVALARPAAPPAAPALPVFRPDALPAEISIDYELTSVFADGHAEYTWKRDGDRYEITGSAQATGFFTLFLEGRIDQTSTGRVTPGGLLPDRFTERMGNGPEEGLTFDWDAKTVEFRYSDKTRNGPLTDGTVDWLSMIFQLAHVPPKGEAMDLRVFTQRRLYEYQLLVVGVEELELPFGRARTLHLHHAGEKPADAVDVWLGIDQHYLPVKLRYPVARNRLMVEQTARSIKAR